MIDANLFYEIINGVWTIALGFMIVFLVRYLYEVWLRIGFKGFLFGMSLPEQFAMAILIADVGNFLVRTSTWAWRTIGADLSKVDGPIAFVLLAGAFIGTLGIFCKLRIVTSVRFGHWPWITCLGCVTTYVIFWVAYDRYSSP